MSSFMRYAFTFYLAYTVIVLAACTTSPENNDFDVAPGFVYNDTTYIASGWGLCESSERTVAYWGLSTLKANGDTISRNWFGVSLSTSDAAPATYPVGSNGSGQDAESPPGKASVLMFRVGGSQESAASRLRVTLFADGDSVRIEGKNILLENGKTLNFNLTNKVVCQS